jgi:predicted TIM-barrel fold metal-dependent hydrolase
MLMETTMGVDTHLYLWLLQVQQYKCASTMGVDTHLNLWQQYT